MTASVLMVSQPTVAGVAQCVLDWSTGLTAAGWQVAVACPQDGWLHHALADAGISWQDWDSQRSPVAGVAAESRHLRAVLAQVRPDAVVLHGSKAGLIGRGVIRGRLPTAFAPHAWSFEAVTGGTAVAALMWERLAARWTSRFLCVSRAERDTGLRKKIRGRYVVARNGVDLLALAAADDDERADLRTSLQISSDTTQLICVGRICEQKGQDVLLAAWADIQAPHRRLTFLGGGPKLADLSAAVTDPRVVFLGDVDRITCLRWMAAADLVVSPSRWEGMALVPLESLAVGTPVVATEVNGAREAIDDQVGRLCLPDDAGELARAVESWLGQTPEDLNQARLRCRQRAETSFDLQQTIEVIDHMLDEMLQERR